MINSIIKLLGLTFYTSELDDFLHNFDERHPQLSASQRNEQAKYSRINALRDKVMTESTDSGFWGAF